VSLPRLPLALKFGLALFAVVAGALVIVYMAVVPRLESRLVAAKLDELERTVPPVSGQFRRANPLTGYDDLAQRSSGRLNARVLVLERLTEDTLSIWADSGGTEPEDARSDEVALEALTTGRTATGRVSLDGAERAELATPIGTNRALLVSASLNDALANVALVRRTVILAGIAALVASLLAGAVAAWRFTRRIQSLEEAAERISAGDFEHPVVDPVRDEVGDLSRAFDVMRLRLAQLDHARREFIANASHELRTPLFSLGGFLELMADEELDERERREFVEEMGAQVTRLTKLATDLLDLSRLDAGQLAVSKGPVDVSVIARTVAEEFRALAEASEHSLSVDADGEVVADADDQRALQIARILLENAIRHTPPGTRVGIGVAKDESSAILAVSDEGPGVPEGDQEHLFERFYRADGGKASGSGLGLAIARELAVRMGGTIELRSQPGETVFTLVLPLSREAISREKASIPVS
jgi:two-component system, OmpR family, sensor kinase